MADFSFIKLEAKTLKWTFKTAGQTAIDMSAATMRAEIYPVGQTTSVVSRAHSDFTVASASDGIVKLSLSTTHLNRTGDYVLELEGKRSNTDVDRSRWTIDITKANMTA